MESKHISIFDVNISSYEHGQVSLLTFDQDCQNMSPPLWLHHKQNPLLPPNLLTKKAVLYRLCFGCIQSVILSSDSTDSNANNLRIRAHYFHFTMYLSSSCSNVCFTQNSILTIRFLLTGKY